MAGHDVVEVDQKYSKVSCLLNTWILDWACHTAWLEFHESRSVDKGSLRDLIQGVICRPFLKVRKYVSQKVRLLIILCRLIDGEDYDLQYSLNSELTVLEDMLKVFRDLIIEEDDLAEEGRSQIPSIKAEAVFVCCRQNDFKTAREIYKRQWPKGERNDYIYAVVKDVIKSENPKHQYLKDYTYQFFVNSLAIYLEKIYRRFDLPYIYKVAESFIECLEASFTSDVSNRNNSSQETPVRKYAASVLKIVEVMEIRKTSDQDVLPSTSGLDAARKQTLSDIQSTISKSNVHEKLPHRPTPTKVPNTNIFKTPGRSVYTGSWVRENGGNAISSITPKIRDKLVRACKKANQQDNHKVSSPVVVLTNQQDKHKASPPVAVLTNQQDKHKASSPVVVLTNQQDKHKVSSPVVVLTNQQDKHKASSPVVVLTNQQDKHKASSPVVVLTNQQDKHKASSPVAVLTNQQDKHKASSPVVVLTNQQDKHKASSPVVVLTNQQDKHKASSPVVVLTNQQDKHKASSPVVVLTNQQDKHKASSPVVVLTNQQDKHKTSSPVVVLTNQQDKHKASSPVVVLRPISPDSDSSDYRDDISAVSGSNIQLASRKRRKWNEDEIRKFYDAACRIGVGKWSEIRNVLKTDRSNVDLKDKWRNLLKTGKIEELMHEKQGSAKKRKASHKLS